MLDKILKDRKVREDVKDKFELAMAVMVIAGFVYKKINEKKEDQNEQD